MEAPVFIHGCFLSSVCFRAQIMWLCFLLAEDDVLMCFPKNLRGFKPRLFSQYEYKHPQIKAESLYFHPYIFHLFFSFQIQFSALESQTMRNIAVLTLCDTVHLPCTHVYVCGSVFLWAQPPVLTALAPHRPIIS